MYTPKRNRYDGGSATHGGSPFQSLNTSFPHDHSFSEIQRKTVPARNTLQVIEQDDSHQLLSYGNAIPVEVAEIFTTASKGNIFAKIHSSGWISVIYQRKLFVWRYTASSIRKVIHCTELQLPSTELTHKTDLSCVMLNQSSDPMQAASSTKTSAMYVSPEGTVRYWSNINRPSNVVEMTLPLAGKQCHTLLPLMPYGCILTTTTCEIYLIVPNVSSISYKPIAVATGVLSSISRRVSSFWARPANSENDYLPCVCDATVDLESSERSFFLIINENLQKWQLSAGSYETDIKMLYEIDIKKCLKNHTSSNVNMVDIESIQVVDMKNTGMGCVMFLVLWYEQTFQCVLATFKSHENQLNLSKLVLINEDIQEEETKEMMLTLPVGDYHVYLSNKHKILTHSLSSKSWQPVRVEFTNSNSIIIGAGCYGNDPLFLSQRHGLMTLKLTQPPEIMLLEKPKLYEDVDNKTTNNLQQQSDTPMFDTSDCYNSIKQLFIHYSKDKQISRLINIVQSIECAPQDLCESILSLSSELLNSSPATDPTWASQQKIGLVTSSVLLLNQLRDKEQIHETYIEFIRKCGILQRAEDLVDDIMFKLCEHAEKLQCSLALLNMYERFGSLIDNVIASLNIDENTGDESARMTKKDLFFTKVTMIERFFSAMITMEGNMLTDVSTVKEQIDLISTVSNIFTSCYIAAWQYRQSMQKGGRDFQRAHVPWTGSSTGVNNRFLLKHQIQLELEQALPNVDSTKVGAALTQQIVLMADLLLDGYEMNLTVLQELKQEYAVIDDEYQQQRQYIILSLVKLSYYEEATTLAEKFEDFVSLIIICEKTQDHEKIEHYKGLFHNQGFSNVLYKWYMDKGDWGTLMSQSGERHEINEFLQSHHQLSWLNYITNKQYGKASETLKDLSSNERTYAARKKTMLVLANLALLASEESPMEIEHRSNEIIRELDVLEYQERIQEYIGKSIDNSKPYDAEELIKLCLCDEIPALNEDMFLILFGLLHDVNNRGTVLEVWKKCIEQDKWDECSQLNYVAVVSQKMFFKCLKFCQENSDYHSLIPSVEELSFETIECNDALQMQLKACYETLAL